MKIAPLFALAACLVSFATASPTVLPADDASRILNKMRQVDLLNQILPVLMTTEQLGKLLPAVEKARSAAIELEKKELERMKKFETKLDPAIKDAKEKGQVPSSELQDEIKAILKEFQQNRTIMVLEQNEAVLKAVEETLDAGQIKAATNSLSVPKGDTSKPSDRERLRRWVRAVLMDPLSYDLLVDLSKKK